MPSFTVQSTDVLQDCRINVLDEITNTVIWYKERFLGDDEIIEHIVHNQTSQIQWIIHRPKRGWYIRIRAPTFPPSVFIPLTPVSSSVTYYTDAALEFRSRTNQITTPETPASPIDPHVYPPTPPAGPKLIIEPASPTSESSPEIMSPRRQSKSCQKQQITQFMLAPYSSLVSSPSAKTTFLSRAFALLKSHQPTQSNSFTLSRVTVATLPPPPYSAPTVSNSTAATSPTPQPLNLPAPSTVHSPLLTYYDRTPIFTVGSFTGQLVIDDTKAEMLGVDTSFWVAVALEYLEFLSDRDSYLAALAD